mgnify:CR=1 FL=1|jgi:hypothetical protein
MRKYEKPLIRNLGGALPTALGQCTLGSVPTTVPNCQDGAVAGTGRCDSGALNNTPPCATGGTPTTGNRTCTTGNNPKA